MKKAVALLLLAAVVLGCAGPKRPWQPLLFATEVSQEGVKPDTADFIYLKIINEPLSIELLGRSDTLPENHYRLFLQIGVYGSPGFDLQRLEVRPESAVVRANGLMCRNIFVDTRKGMKPWEANSLHFFISDRDSLLGVMGDSSTVHLEIRLDGYAVYDGRPIVVQPISAFDPWIARWVRGVPRRR